MDSNYGLLVLIGISLLIFFVLREFWAWYTKTNEIIKILNAQTELLNGIVKSIQDGKKTNDDFLDYHSVLLREILEAIKNNKSK